MHNPHTYTLQQGLLVSPVEIMPYVEHPNDGHVAPAETSVAEEDSRCRLVMRSETVIDRPQLEM